MSVGGVTGATLLVLSMAPALSGFSSSATFDLEADLGGGGGYTYTGSPVSHAMSCVQCHQDGAGYGLGVTIHTTPPGLLEQGYQPGVVYNVVLHLNGESRGLQRNGGCQGGFAGCNRNLFVAEFLDPSGVTAGTVCPDGIDFDPTGACTEEAGRRTTLLRDRRAVSGQSLSSPLDCADPSAVAGQCVDSAAMRAAGATDEEVYAAYNLLVRGSTVWSFQWRAPDQAGAPVDLWVGLVDGDGGTTVDPRYADYVNDAVVVKRFTIAAFGAALAATSGGCAAGGVGAALWLAGVAAALLLGMRRRAA